MSLWSNAIEQRFRHPSHAGPLDAPGLLSGRACANGLELSLDLAVEGGTIRQAAFRALGCPATIAVADWLAEQLAGVPLDRARDVNWPACEQALELPASRRSCLLLAQDALEAAIGGFHGARQSL
ncbi:MAG: hypothetical protein CMN28_04060 [Salinisphaeraceae bacterium]|jgi:nitrogen fixation NifU-like protein|nr:hypothetical protein [Salinisphaeraceae bacterium]